MSRDQAWLLIALGTLVAGFLLALVLTLQDINTTMNRSTDRIEYQGIRIQEIMAGQQP